VEIVPQQRLAMNVPGSISQQNQANWDRHQTCPPALRNFT